MNLYLQAAQHIRKALPSEPDLRDFVRTAALAANSHNTHPWRVRIAENTVDILPDFTRRTPIADPDDHHLYVSLGCAPETLFVAANVHGRLIAANNKTKMSAAELRQLKGSAARDGVDCMLITDHSKLDEALKFIQAGNSAQMDDPNFARELKSLIRFSANISIKHADGLFGPAARTPSSPNSLHPPQALQFLVQPKKRRKAGSISGVALSGSR